MGMLLAAIFAAYFLFSAGLTAILGAEDSENQEMLTVPIQQMARVYRYDKESLTEEEMETLYEIIPEDALRFYTPKVSDGVKIWFRNDAFAENPAKYGRLWLKLGLKHPFTYLNAWFIGTLSYRKKAKGKGQEMHTSRYGGNTSSQKRWQIRTTVSSIRQKTFLSLSPSHTTQ